MMIILEMWISLKNKKYALGAQIDNMKDIDAILEALKTSAKQSILKIHKEAK